MTIALEFVILLLLVIANGIFAMSETAIISSRAPRLQDRASRGDKGAQTALELKEDPSRFLSTVQIGITLVGILAGAYGGAKLRDQFAVWFEDVPLVGQYRWGLSFWVVVLLTSYLSLVIGELVPKRIALSRTEGLAAAIARPMRWLSVVASPVVWVLSKSTDLVVAILGVKAVDEPPVTEEEVKIMIRTGTQAGVFEQEEHDLVRSVFRFADKRVTSLMTPRSEIIWLDVSDSLEVVVRKISKTGFSRFPVCQGDLDKVVGIVSVKELWSRQVKGESVDLALLARKPLFVMEHISGFQLHRMFKDTGNQAALVVDEYGVIKGLVTLVDMMTAIMGEIPEAEGVEEPEVVKLDENTWLVDAMISFGDFLELTDIGPLPEDEEDYQILAGFVLAHLDEFPKEGSAFNYQKYRFEVTHMDHNRIDQVKVSLISPDEPEHKVEE